MSESELEIYAFESVADKWVTLAQNMPADNELFVLSPFITGNTILQVFKSCPSNKRYLITTLSPDAYLGGALDITILRQLIKEHVKVFHLKNLHAKVLLTGKNVTIGSQNFTDGGRLNVEASIALEITKTQKQTLEMGVNEIIENSSFVDDSVLDVFEIEAERLRNKFKELQKGLLEVDVAIEKYFLKDNDIKNIALDEVETTKSKFEQHFLSIPVKVIEKEYETDWTYGNYFTLQSTDYQEILNVFIKSDGELFKLKNQMRYLCLELNTLRPYWIRANKKQIGKFANGVTFSAWFSPDLHSRVKVNLLDPKEEHDYSNMRIEYETKKYGMIQVGVLFSGQDFHLMSVQNNAVDKPVEIITDWTKLHSDYVKPILEQAPSQLLRPFKYKNSNQGLSPSRLFTANQKMKLGLQKLGDEHFYILQ